MATSRYIKQQNNTKNHWLIPLLAVFFAAMGTVFAFFGYEAGQYFTMVVLLMGALLNVDDSFCLILFCLPFTSLLKLSASSISVLPFLYLLFLPSIPMHIISAGVTVLGAYLPTKRILNDTIAEGIRKDTD